MATPCMIYAFYDICHCPLNAVRYWHGAIVRE